MLQRPLKARWISDLSIVVFLGIVASIAMAAFHSALGVIVLLLVPIAIFFFPEAMSRVSRGAAAVARDFTWWKGLWLLLFASGLTFRVRDVREISGEPVDSAALFRIILEGLAAFVLIKRLAFRQTAWVGSLFRGLVGLLTCYSLVCAVSTLWSVYPEWTLYKSAEYLLDVVVLATVLVAVRSTEGFKKLFDWTWILYGVVVLMVWMGAVIDPGDAFLPGVGTLGVQLTGVFPVESANSVGDYGAVLTLVGFNRLLLDRIREHRTWYGLVFAVGAITLIFSQTRSSIAGCGLGLIIVLVLSGRVALGAFLGAASAVVLSLRGAGTLVQEFMQRGETEEVYGSLSGRTNWWQYAWQKFLEHPFSGYGAYAGGRFVVMAQLLRGATSSVHNTLMETLVGTGIWGAALITLALLATWLSLVRSFWRYSFGSLERSLAVEALAILALATVRSVFSVSLIWHPALLFFLALGYAEFLRRLRSSRVIRVDSAVDEVNAIPADATSPT